jgi:hypothetical protein
MEGIVFVIFAIFCENDSSSLLPRCSVLTPISGSTGRKRHTSEAELRQRRMKHFKQKITKSHHL